MKYLLILWTTVLVALARAQFLEPDCSIFEYFPQFVNDPSSCRAYWFCNSKIEEPISDKCPVGYNFNERKQLCDSPIDYPCTDPTDPPEHTTTPEPATTVRPPRPPGNVCDGLKDGQLVNDPTLCRAFFECRNNVALPRQCDVGLNFNEELQKCDRPTFTPCSNDDFECPFHGISRWEVPGSCVEYNFCFSGQHRVQTCSEGLLFDSSIARCSLEENVECVRDLCPIDNDIDNIVTYPSENDCEQYYMCYDNNRELQYCAPGTHWNQEVQRCQTPEDAQCELATQPTTVPTTEITTEETTEQTTDPNTTEPPPFEIECEPSAVPYLLPHPFICQNYFICLNEEPFEKQCLEGLVFDALQTGCNVPERATCAEGSTRQITKQRNYFMNYIARH